MIKTITTIRSKPALAFAGLCAGSTLFVLFDDLMRSGGISSIHSGHVASFAMLALTMYVGHAMWGAFKAKKLAAIGAVLVFVCGTAFVVLTSAGRTAHVMADKAMIAGEANAKYESAKARAAKFERDYDDKKAAAAKECASGAKSKCGGKSLTAARAKLDFDEARKEADALRPQIAASDYLQAAALIAAFTGGDKAVIESKLLLLIPFLQAVALEIGFLVCSHLAVSHVDVESAPRQFPAPVLKAETIPDAPKVLTAEMVSKLKAEGKKHSEIASMFGVNQGRVSELLNGQRNLVVLN